MQPEESSDALDVIPRRSSTDGRLPRWTAACSQNADLTLLSFAQVSAGICIPWIT